MKKVIYTLGALLGFTVLSNQAFAQHEQGQSNINVGIGFVAFGLEGDVVVPPVSLSYEYGINDVFSVGVFAGYTSSELDFFAGFGDAEPFTFTYMMFGARGSYHFELIDGMDTYAGLLVGYNNAKLDLGDDADPLVEDLFDVGGILYGVYVGGRYHFTDNIGAFLEVGYGISAVNLGVTLRF